MPRTVAVPRLVTALQMAAAAAAILLIGVVIVSFAVPGTVRTRGSLVASVSASLFDDANGTAIFPSSTQVLPDQTISGCISINAVSAGADEAVLLQASHLTGTLAADLSLVVQSGSGGRAGDCTGFTGSVIWTGTLAQLSADPGVPLNWDPHSSPQRSFRITASSRPVTWTTGRNATADLVWKVIYTGTPLVPGSQDGPAPTATGPTSGVVPQQTLPAGPVPPDVAAGGRADITLRPSLLSQVLRRTLTTLLRTAGSPQYPVSALTIVMIFVVIEQWYERRDPKLIDAARSARDTELVFPDLFGPGPGPAE